MVGWRLSHRRYILYFNYQNANNIIITQTQNNVFEFLNETLFNFFLLDMQSGRAARTWSWCAACLSHYIFTLQRCSNFFFLILPSSLSVLPPGFSPTRSLIFIYLFFSSLKPFQPITRNVQVRTDLFPTDCRYPTSSIAFIFFSFLCSSDYV